MGGKLALTAVLLASATACLDYDLPYLCDPTSGGRRVGFYSTGDCVGLDSPVFLGHEWLTYLANHSPDNDGPPLFTQEKGLDPHATPQIDLIVEGNRHTDYPLELLVHLDNGVTAYLDALLSYHERPDNQAPHFILRADNYTWEAWQEALCVIENKTVAGAALWPDEPEAALSIIGSATHTLQDSYAGAHTVRCDPDPDNPNLPSIPPGLDCNENPWCLVKLKAFVTRPGVFADANPDPDAPDYDLDIEYHARHDYDANPGHAVSGDAIFLDELDCHEPIGAQKAWECMLDNARQSVLGTRAYLSVVRMLLDSGASAEEIRLGLAAYFAEHMQLCYAPPWDRLPCPPAPRHGEKDFDHLASP